MEVSSRVNSNKSCQDGKPPELPKACSAVAQPVNSFKVKEQQKMSDIVDGKSSGLTVEI